MDLPERSDRSEPAELPTLATLDTLAALDMVPAVPDADRGPAPDPTALSGGTSATTAAAASGSDALISVVFGILESKERRGQMLALPQAMSISSSIKSQAHAQVH